MKIWKLVTEYKKAPNYRRLSDNSKRLYDYAANRLCDHFGEKDVESIKRSDVIRYLMDNSKTPAATNSTVQFASVLFQCAVDLDLMQSNPASRIKMNKTGSHKRWMASDVKKMIQLNDRRVSTAVAIAWYTGQREGDIISMKWGDLKDGDITIVQQKTKLEMKIKAHPDLLAYLETVRGSEPDSYYMVSGKSKLHPSTFRYSFSQRAKDAGVKKVFHGIRKGVACALSEEGLPLSDIAALLGHKSTRMTEYYTKESDRKKMTARAVDSIRRVA